MTARPNAAVDGQLALPLLPLLPTPQKPELAAHVAPGWQDRAACADMHGDVFYPDEDASPELVAAARRVCLTCPVRDSCRAHALLDDEEHGVWGGVTEAERDELRSELSTGDLTVGGALSRLYPRRRLPWEEAA